MWRFMALAEPIINRVDDSNGTVGAVFRAACDDLGTLAAKAKPDPVVLAEHVFAAVTKNDYGEFDGLLPAIFPALGKRGVTALKARLVAAMPKRAATDRYDSRAAAVRRALQDLADGEEDVDHRDALVATGQVEHAQRLRWAAFEARLTVERLRSYLKALPDFEDVLAEERAMEHALRFRNFSLCTSFTNGPHTGKRPTWSLLETVRSTATSTTCSIPRRYGWRAPIR
jgi:Arc/MetJ-type ribon-helix-helix transcriptional regulator